MVPLIHRDKRPHRISVIAVLIMFLLPGCTSMQTPAESQDHFSSSGSCINVSGTVLGKLKMNSSVDLYRAGRLDYESILTTIREEEPDRHTNIYSDQSFTFSCVPEGNYLLNIPATSYDQAFGAPIATEESENHLRVDALLQGGCSDTYFSAFSVSYIE